MSPLNHDSHACPNHRAAARNSDARGQAPRRRIGPDDHGGDRGGATRPADAKACRAGSSTRAAADRRVGRDATGRRPGGPRNASRHHGFRR
ncbi:MAG: hypothetical protein M8860_04685 [marine benthic group bacterium]|nr:hypothetical protein [Candidatus Carthagonibacter metallireducens]